MRGQCLECEFSAVSSSRLIVDSRKIRAFGNDALHKLARCLIEQVDAGEVFLRNGKTLTAFEAIKEFVETEASKISA